jgi:hypothetical protein
MSSEICNSWSGLLSFRIRIPGCGEPSHGVITLKEGGDKYLAKEGQKLLLSACYRLRHVVTLITVFGMTAADMGEVLIQDPYVLVFIGTGHNVAFVHQDSEK